MKYRHNFVNLLLIAFIVCLINMITGYIYLRFDFSSGKIYSVSKATKRMLKKLQRPVIINAYFSKNLPVQYMENKRYLEDLLKEYRTYSRGKISYKFIDPSDDKDEMRRCTAYGIPPIRFTIVRRDKYEVQEGFMGVAFIYGDRTESIPVVKDLDALEYDITSRIKKLVTETPKKVAFTTGHEEISITGQFPELANKINLNYTMVSVNPRNEDFSKDISGILIVGPREKFSDDALFRIDQAVLSGIPTAFLVDVFSIDRQTFWARKLDLGIEKLLDNYGVKIKPGFVLDLHNQRIVVRTSQAFFVIENILDYPLFPIVTEFKKDNFLVKDLAQLTLTYVSPVELKEGVKGEIIMKSSPRSWYMENPYSVSPFSNFYPRDKSAFKQYDLACIVEGKFKSYFSDKPRKEQINESIGSSRILVLPCSGIVNSEPSFLLSIVDWLCADEDLIKIRSKRIVPRHLKDIPYSFKFAYKHSMMFLPPVCVVLFGLIRWRIRAKIRKIIQQSYMYSK